MKIKDSKLSLNDLTVLGLVLESEGSVSGQNIEQAVENRGMRVWTNIGKSSIYYALKKLEKNGFVTSEEDIVERKDNPPIKKVYYQATKEGKKELQHAVTTILLNPEKIVDPFDIALANSQYLEDVKLTTLLEQRIEVIKSRQAFLNEHLQYFKQPDAEGYDIHGNPTQANFHIVRALFSRPLNILESKKNWLRDFITTLKKLEEE